MGRDIHTSPLRTMNNIPNPAMRVRSVATSGSVTNTVKTPMMLLKDMPGIEKLQTASTNRIQNRYNGQRFISLHSPERCLEALTREGAPSTTLPGAVGATPVRAFSLQSQGP